MAHLLTVGDKSQHHKKKHEKSNPKKAATYSLLAGSFVEGLQPGLDDLGRVVIVQIKPGDG